MDGELVSRGEIEALLFNVSDIATALFDILELLKGGDGDDDEQD